MIVILLLYTSLPKSLPDLVNIHMKTFLTTISFLFLINVAMADHTDDGKCIDEIKHLQTLEASADKGSSEYASAREKKSEGLGKRLNGKEDECEALMKEAIAFID